jgi:radical SAM protein with 4Fe4S-binding SPASM domain
VQEFFIQWHLTERCNLRCAHCYQQDVRCGELPPQLVRHYLGEIISTLDYWRDSYGLTFQPLLHLTGGEPFVYPALWDIMEHGRFLGFDLAVLTNGTLVDAPTARRLADLGVESVQVSVEGPPAVHDAVRGPGSFARALAGTRNLVAAGVRVTFSVTLSSVNAPFVRDLAGLAAENGVARIGYSRLVPCGRGREMSDRCLSSREISAVYREMAAWTFPGLEIIPKDPLHCLFEPPPGPGAGEGVPLGGCSAGVSGVTVMPDGTVMPCRRMNLPIGNLRETSFRELWVASPVLENLRRQGNYHGRCGRCPYWTVCRGCRAVAGTWAEAGEDNYLAEDPDCWWDPDAEAGGTEKNDVGSVPRSGA